MNMIANKTNAWNLDLSIIIPVYNEEESIVELAEEVDKVMHDTSWSWECLWIDDGSTDRTLYKLQQINERNNHHQFIALSQNCGQSAALSVGFRFTRGKVIATLDGDGQNDPADIPPMMKKLLELNADMINGWREKRRDNVIKKLSSYIANGFRNWMTNEQVRDVGCSLRVFRHQCVENLPTFRGMHRFLPTLARMSGCSKIIEMPVRHRPRKYGLTKYGIHNRLWVGIVDTFAVRWMQFRLVYPEVKSSSLDKGGGKPE
ncbi:MAG: glycosyltransferase family 2 protein [Candidatus Methylomirabilales bacterium]